MKYDYLAALTVFLKALGKPIPEAEYRFHPPRRWRFDFCFRDRKVAVEIDGGIWVNGRHSRGKGMQADMEKSNQAVLDGWRVFHVTPQMVMNGEAALLLSEALDKL